MNKDRIGASKQAEKSPKSGKKRRGVQDEHRSAFRYLAAERKPSFPPSYPL